MLITCRTPRLFLSAHPAPDRLVEELPERPVRDGLGRKATNAVGCGDVRRLPAEQNRTRDRLREREPALRIEHEVVLQALRDQDVPGLVVLRRCFGRGHPAVIQRSSRRRVKASRFHTGPARRPPNAGASAQTRIQAPNVTGTQAVWYCGTPPLLITQMMPLATGLGGGGARRRNEESEVGRGVAHAEFVSNVAV